jgi:signal peptidase
LFCYAHFLKNHVFSYDPHDEGGYNMIQEKEHSIRHRVGNIIGFAVILALLPVLIINITLIVKSFINADEVPSVGGYLPLIVLTDSMEPNIQSGDLIICRKTDPASVEVGDVISFFDPAGNGTGVVSHRVTSIINEDGVISFRTQGDANKAEDTAVVPSENLVGVYRHRIAGAGSLAMFLQTSTGLIICVGLPLLLLVGYDLLRRRAYERNQKEDTDALLRELEELYREKGEI